MKIIIMNHDGTERIIKGVESLRVQRFSPKAKRPDMLVLYGAEKTLTVDLSEVEYFYTESE